VPSYCAFRPPYLLVFDESGGRAEVRDVTTGRLCEVVEEQGMKPLRTTRMDGDLLVQGPRGLLQLVEVSRS
jgi:hypothetical protein